MSSQNDPTLTPEETLDASRVTPKTPLPPMEHLFLMYGKPCFYRGELTANCGKAKSGKTLFLSILMACTMREQPEPDENGNVSLAKVLALERASGNAIKVLWIDTEQSKQSTQDIEINRIMPLAGLNDISDNQFYAYNLRGLGYEIRRKLVEMAVMKVEPDLVIIDGIKDLVPDINDAVQATLLMEQLMSIAQNGNCCIVNVLHQNKSDADNKMRGSIGTELTNKAFEVFQCEYIEESDIFKVKHAMSRKHRIRKKMYYCLDDDGLPQECDAPDLQPRGEGGRWISKPKQTVTPETKWDAFNPKYIIHTDGKDTYEWDLHTLFEDAFEGKDSRPFGHVMAAALRLSHIADPKLYYTLVDQAEQKKIIRSVKHPMSGDAYLEFLIDNLPF
ncbi:MAG: AAA family ATPase [Prevotella sp.]|nr:AAA family ATPase [Prevotella sp.]